MRELVDIKKTKLQTNKQTNKNRPRIKDWGTLGANAKACLRLLGFCVGHAAGATWARRTVNWRQSSNT